MKVARMTVSKSLSRWLNYLSDALTGVGVVARTPVVAADLSLNGVEPNFRGNHLIRALDKP